MTDDPFEFTPTATPQETAEVLDAATRMRQAAGRLRELIAPATRGPWLADPTGTVVAAADLVPDGDGRDVLPTNGPSEVAECYRSEWAGERGANAELIAALRSLAAPLAAWLDDSANEAEQIGPNRFALALADVLLRPGTEPAGPA